MSLASKPSFADDQVNRDLLRRRAYNLRWATLPADVIPLTAADPDFSIAPEIREAVTAYISGGVLSYGPAEGLPEFREACARVVTERKGVPCEPSRVLAIDSAASAMFIVARFALKPGDEAIIFDPVDFLFKQSVESAGAKAVLAPVDAVTGRFDFEALKRLITPRTRLIGLCNPHNPVGRVMTRAELSIIAELAVTHDLWIMNDEIWSDIVYSPHKHLSLPALGREIHDKTISVYGFSKTFGLAGLRVGYIVAPTDAVFEDLMKVSAVRTTAAGVSTLSQIAATAAYDRCWYWADAFVEHLTQVRDYAVSRLNAMPGLRCRAPEGTYVLFPEIRALGRSGQELADLLLQDARVAVVPGAAQWFGPGAEGHIRICFSTSMGIMREALDRIEGALKKLS